MLQMVPFDIFIPVVISPLLLLPVAFALIFVAVLGSIDVVEIYNYP